MVTLRFRFIESRLGLSPFRRSLIICNIKAFLPSEFKNWLAQVVGVSYSSQYRQKFVSSKNLYLGWSFAYPSRT